MHELNSKIIKIYKNVSQLQPNVSSARITLESCFKMETVGNLILYKKGMDLYRVILNGLGAMTSNSRGTDLSFSKDNMHERVKRTQSKNIFSS